MPTNFHENRGPRPAPIIKMSIRFGPYTPTDRAKWAERNVVLTDDITFVLRHLANVIEHGSKITRTHPHPLYNRAGEKIGTITVR